MQRTVVPSMAWQLGCHLSPSHFYEPLRSISIWKTYSKVWRSSHTCWVVKSGTDLYVNKYSMVEVLVCACHLCSSTPVDYQRWLKFLSLLALAHVGDVFYKNQSFYKSYRFRAGVGNPWQAMLLFWPTKKISDKQ